MLDDYLPVANKMNIGDSVQLDRSTHFGSGLDRLGPDPVTQAAYMMRALKAIGFQGTSRQIERHVFRVWRIK